jgi:hypothetical protein
MTNQEQHDKRVIRLLRKDAERRKYIKEYMKEYRANKKLETGKGQKQYYKPEDLKTIQKASYKLKTVLNDVRFLFKE